MLLKLAEHRQVIFALARRDEVTLATASSDDEALIKGFRLTTLIN